MTNELKAQPVENALEVLKSYELEGEFWLETSIPLNDYEAFSRYPVAVTFEGRVYGRTGWNSDRGRVYFCTSRPVALSL